MIDGCTQRELNSEQMNNMATAALVSRLPNATLENDFKNAISWAAFHVRLLYSHKPAVRNLSSTLCMRRFSVASSVRKVSASASATP